MTIKYVWKKKLWKVINSLKKHTLRTTNLINKQIMENYKINIWAEPFIRKRSRILLKNHKENFYCNSKVRTICPGKSDLRKLSKAILNTYIPVLRERIRL